MYTMILVGELKLGQLLVDLSQTDLFIAIKNILEVTSFFVTIIGIIIIFINIIQFRKSVEQRQYDVEFKKKEIAVEILNKFANEIIPAMDEYINKVNTELADSSITELKKRDKDFEEAVFIRIQLSSGVITIFNKLEQVCVYIRADLADSSILFEPMNSTLCGFVKSNEDALDFLKENDVPYVNLRHVYTIWSGKKGAQIIDMKINELQKQKQELNKQL